MTDSSKVKLHLTTKCAFAAFVLFVAIGLLGIPAGPALLQIVVFTLLGVISLFLNIAAVMVEKTRWAKYVSIGLSLLLVLLVVGILMIVAHFDRWGN